MNWDQIERNWAAMTRRVRADWPLESDDLLQTVLPSEAASPAQERRVPLPSDGGLRLSNE